LDIITRLNHLYCALPNSSHSTLLRNKVQALHFFFRHKREAIYKSPKAVRLRVTRICRILFKIGSSLDFTASRSELLKMCDLWMVLLSSEQAFNWYWPRKNRYSKFRVHLAEKPGNLEARGVNHLLNWFRLFYGWQLQETSQVNARTLN